MILVVATTAAAVLAGVNIYSELKERQKEKEDFAAVSQIAEPTVTAEQTESEQAEPTEEPAAERNIPALIAANTDCIGWLSIDGTNISYPVMYTPHDPQNISAETSMENTAKAVCRSLTGGATSKAPTSLSTVTICETV